MNLGNAPFGDTQNQGDLLKADAVAVMLLHHIGFAFRQTFQRLMHPCDKFVPRKTVVSRGSGVGDGFDIGARLALQQHTDRQFCGKARERGKGIGLFRFIPMLKRTQTFSFDPVAMGIMSRSLAGLSKSVMNMALDAAAGVSLTRWAR